MGAVIIAAALLLPLPHAQVAQNAESPADTAPQSNTIIVPQAPTKNDTMTEPPLLPSGPSAGAGRLPDTMLLPVPFAPQAPLGEWSDMRQDYGCEEASSLMVWHWLHGMPWSLKNAREEIIALSEWERERYGDFHDRSAGDTAVMFREYFQYDQVRVAYDIGIHDIKRELASGNAVIVPVHGQKLDNPYFSPPGPIQHMVVVRGYDDETREFIVNDPGTKRGEAIRYRYDTFARALQDYGTGWNEPIEAVRSAMIIVAPRVF